MNYFLQERTNIRDNPVITYLNKHMGNGLMQTVYADQIEAQKSWFDS